MLRFNLQSASTKGHLEFDVSPDDWILWAQQVGIRREVIAFLRFRPKLLHDFDPLSSGKAFASPRSWAFLSGILDANPDPDVEYELFRGTVGDGAAAEFMGFLRVWRGLPSVEDILANPADALVPDRHHFSCPVHSSQGCFRR